MQRWLLAPILAGALIFITGRNHESSSARNIVVTLAAIMAAVITFANALYLIAVSAGGASADPAQGVSLPAPSAARLAPAQSGEVTLIEITTDFNEPVGIDHHAPTNQVVISVNYPSGLPHNFELVSKDGERERFSIVSGLTDEVKIATARDRRGGFQPGELFVGTGTPGVVARVSADGSTIEDPWVTLPGENGLLRGSLHVDRTGVFGGDLIVVTTEGGVWRVSSSGNATKLADVGERLEGLTTIPNDEEKYGPWAGKILAGAEEESRIYAIDADGNFDFYELGIEPEDIDVIAGSENFFGVDYGGSTLWGAPPAEFAEMVGDVLIAQEHPGILWHVRWDGEEFDVNEVARVSQWEHVTFSSAGISEVAVLPPTTETDDGSGIVLLALGVLAIVIVAGTAGGMLLARRRRAAVLGADMALRRPAGRDPDKPVFAGTGPLGSPFEADAWIEVVSPEDLGPFPLGEEPVTVGFTGDCTICLPDSGGQVGARLRVWRREGRYMLHNLSRLGAATVGGKPVTWAVLEDGDEIQVGSCRLIFRTKGPSGDA